MSTDEAVKAQGSVKWFNDQKGFGFITRDDGVDVFVHQTEIVQDGFRTLEEGQQVEFEIMESDKGPQAQDVVVVTPAE